MRLVAGIVFYAASSKLEIDCDCQSTEKRSILWNAPSSVTLPALKRQIKGCGVSGDLAFLGWLAFHGRSANRRMRQMAGFGKSHDRRHRSYERMRRLRGSGVISRSICKSHDAAICMIGYFTRDRQMRGWGHFKHCRRFSHMFSQTLFNFSKFLSVRNYTIHNMWLVQNLNFKTATFQFFFSQSYQNQVTLQWRTCAQALRWTIDDISRCKCRIVS